MTTPRRLFADEGGSLPALGEALEFLGLIRAIDHGLETASKRMARAAGITGLQRLVLHVVGRFPGMTARQLAVTVHTHPSTLTGVLRRLERGGLLCRRTDPKDGRRASLGLTPAGQRLDAEVAGIAETTVDRLLAELPPQQIYIARQVLAALALRLGVDGAPKG
jgi:MarR family transcriptional regulator, organic hydroperoxide resistance regulator